MIWDKVPGATGVSQRVTRWAYQQAEATGSQVWLEQKRLVSLDPGWRELPGMVA